MNEKPSTCTITLAQIPTPAKALATCVIMTLALGMIGALGQIYVHDIIPTFFSAAIDSGSDTPPDHTDMDMKKDENLSEPTAERGDLFSDLADKKPEPDVEPLYKNEQFVWILKWSHIHLFGINMIFILMGAITLFLNISTRARTWLVVLPFLGILVDIGAMWLKAFVSPVFFWLHIPGGGVFGVVFFYVSLRALREMWGQG